MRHQLRARVCNPGTLAICACQPEIQVETGSPDPNAIDAFCSLSAPIPVPPELEGNNCTLGVEYLNQGNVTSRLWACPTTAHIPAQIVWTGYQYPYPPYPPYTYMTPEVLLGSEGKSAWDSRCLGDAWWLPFLGSSWELVEQDVPPVVNTGGCGAGCNHL